MSGPEPSVLQAGVPGGGELAPFAAAPFDMVEDLCGDPNADLVVFLAGNQYMVLPDLVAGFLRAHPAVGSVFYETLPPGIVVQQFRRGGLRMGSLEVRARPDVLALSPTALHELGAEGLVGPARRYASNDLALLVAAGNPLHLSGWADLGRPGVRVAFPDPATEGIGRLALEALQASGGPGLRRTIELDKASRGEVVFTSIHHRQGPAWLAVGASDAAVVWSTEALHHQGLGGPFDTVTIPGSQNRRGAYAAAVVANAAHRDAASAFVDHLCSEAGRATYAARGFAVGDGDDDGDCRAVVPGQPRPMSRKEDP